ncbi:MAG: rod shape-determining protein RodA [Dehalococcoidia bacterium]
MRSWRETRPFDYVMLAAAVALTCFGLILIYSGSINTMGTGLENLQGPTGRQMVFGILAVMVCLIVSRFDYRWLAQGSTLMYIGLILALIFVMTVHGTEEYGSRRWINVGPFHIQPSEIGKLVIILVLARYLSENQDNINDPRVFFSSLALAGVPALLVFAEPDLGSASIFFFIWLGMVIMAGASMRLVLSTLGMGLAMLPFAVIAVITDYQRDRISLFLDPNKEALGDGFNILQAEISIGSGGFFGQGLTHGTQTQLDYLRTQTTDYVFSVLGEELGFIGAMLLFSLYILLLFRGLRAAGMSQDVFGRLVAIGVVIFILFQTFINIAVNLRLFPVTGIPLPFISAGGSSLVTVFIAIGLLQSVVMRRNQVTL